MIPIHAPYQRIAVGQQGKISQEESKTDDQ
jgi:hypothetical protein